MLWCCCASKVEPGRTDKLSNKGKRGTVKEPGIIQETRARFKQKSHRHIKTGPYSTNLLAITVTKYANPTSKELATKGATLQND